jgi:hypothetical protein
MRFIGLLTLIILPTIMANAGPRYAHDNTKHIRIDTAHDDSNDDSHDRIDALQTTTAPLIPITTQTLLGASVSTSSTVPFSFVGLSASSTPMRALYLNCFVLFGLKAQITRMTSSQVSMITQQFPDLQPQITAMNKDCTKYIPAGANANYREWFPIDQWQAYCALKSYYPLLQKILLQFELSGTSLITILTTLPSQLSTLQQQLLALDTVC